ncbi:reverse transcriptase domain-containing protein [Tanacetum coccineum]
MENEVDISALTMEQYIALIPDDIKPGIVNPKIGDDVEFEINANFMRELRRKLFTGTDGSITTWDLLKKEFIRRYCHPFIIVKKLEEIRNFKQERDETLYYAWERYNDLLYQCTLHDLNSQLYTGLDISTRKILNSNGFLPLTTPTQALESIQVMADHSHNWYDETTIGEGINDVLDNVDVIHESFKGEHLSKETFEGTNGSPYRTHEIVRMIENPEEIHNAKA